MKFDNFLETVDDWGRFQKVKYTLICLTYMLPSIMVFIYSFTAAVPNFRCQNPDLASNDSYNDELNSLFTSQYKPNKTQCEKEQGVLSLKECQRCYIQSDTLSQQNQSESNKALKQCTDYVFDRTYYETTLVEEWKLVCDDVAYRSATQMCYFFGYMVGSLVFGILADKYGRRPVMSVSFILMTVAGFLCAVGPQESMGFWTPYLLYMFARFLLACATRGISVSGFVLGTEIVGQKKRLLAGIVIEYFFAFGQLFLLAFTIFIRTWKALTVAISAFTVPFMFFYFILPESPRWLTSKGKFDEAERVLRRIAATNKRTFDEKAFQAMKEEQEKQMHQTSDQVGVASLFRSRIMCIISLNLFFQWLAQNLAFYGVGQNTGSWDINPRLAFALSAVVEIFGYITVHLILDRVGRKRPYCGSSILFAFVAFLILPVKQYTTDGGQARYVILGTINLLTKYFASVSYAIIYIYANELFPTHARNSGMGICSMVARIGAIGGSFFNDVLSRISEHLPVILYGAVSITAALLALMFPETMNKALPQTVADVENMKAISYSRKKSQIAVVTDTSSSAITEDKMEAKDPSRHASDDRRNASG